MELKTNLKTGETVKDFSCPCQAWTIRCGDSPKPPEEEAILIHDCAELKVYQQKKGLGRFYIKNSQNTPLK